MTTKAQPPRGERYRVIADELRAAISRGDYAQGAQLPTEMELAEQYRVTRPTVRQAQDLLEAEGLLVRIPRQGSFVRVYTPMTWHMTHGADPGHLGQVPVDSYSADVEAAGYSHRQEITVGIDKGSRKLDIYTLAELLHLKDDDLVLARRRIRFIGPNSDSPANVPESIYDSYYPLDLVQDTPIMAPESVHTVRILAEKGYTATRITDVCIPRMANSSEQERLQLAPVTPVLERIRTTYTSKASPIYVQHVITPGNGARFVYDIDFARNGSTK